MDTQEFLEAIYGEQKGCIFISTIGYTGNLDQHKDILWHEPTGISPGSYVQLRKAEDVYCSVAVFSQNKRTDQDPYAVAQVVWAESDAADTDVFRLPPSIIVNTSPGRYHCWWILDKSVPAAEASRVSKKLYIAHKDDGVDSGFAVSKLMRVPGTTNNKYDEPFEVVVTEHNDNVYTLSQIDSEYGDISVGTSLTAEQENIEFDPQEYTEEELSRLRSYADVSWQNDIARLHQEQEAGWNGEGWDNITFQVACNLIRNANAPWSEYELGEVFPTLDEHAPQDATFNSEQIQIKYLSALEKVGNATLALPAWAVDKITVDLPDFPKGQAVIEIEHLIASANLMTEYTVALQEEETFEDRLTFFLSALWKVSDSPENIMGLTMNASFVKYASPAIDARLVWSRVLDVQPSKVDPYNRRVLFLTHKERESLSKDAFVEKYVQWVRSRTDSAETYQRSFAYMLLSCTFGDRAVIPLDWQVAKLNLWVIIAGDTTRTRKSTAKDLFLNVLHEYQEFVGDAVDIGEDITSEELPRVLAQRDGLVSLMVKEEIQSWFEEASGAKSYRVGEKGMLTKMFDGTVPIMRRANKEASILQATSTIFNLVGVGIREHIGGALTKRDFESGFMPRALWSVADPKPYQKGEDHIDLTREGVQARREARGRAFKGRESARDMAQDLYERSARWSPDHPTPVFLTRDANRRYNNWTDEAKDSLRSASHGKILEAAFDRLSKAVLKSAVLNALYDGKDEVELPHMLDAIHQAEWWFNDMVRMVDEVSSSDFERKLYEVERYILDGKENRRTGLQIRRNFARWKPREMEEILEALRQQGRIRPDGRDYIGFR